LNLFCAGTVKTMMPKLKAQNFENMELIRPLYLVEEEYIKRFIQNSGIWPLNCACMVAAKRIGNKRFEIKDLIEQLKPRFNNLEINIFRALENVQMDGVIAWKEGDVKHSFLDEY